MVECNSINASNIYPNLNDQQLFRWNKIKKIKDYFIWDTREIGLKSKRLSKDIASFDYFDSSLFYKKKKHNKIILLARTKLNSIKSKISEALINNEIGNEHFTTIINKERNSRELK